MGDARLSSRFHLVVSDLDLENKDVMCKRVYTKMFLRVAMDGKVLHRSPVLKKDVPYKWGVGECETVVARKFFFDLLI